MASPCASLARDEIARRVAEVLRMTQLEGYGERAIRELSGGQQQRVALARAMVIQPDILLMDEPLGALDRQLRKEVQFEIRSLHKARPRTTIYVTHDQEEALVMSDRIAVMRAGRIVQLGSGADIYEQPADTFVARFLGESNLLEGTVRTLADGGRRSTFRFSRSARRTRGEGLRAGAKASALLRPESVRAQAEACKARVCERVYLGELIAVRCARQRPRALVSPPRVEWSGRDVVEIGWDASAVSILPDASVQS
jgi:ABC-type Fe3+/spermidine/putrescine transport system ATPase subunit